MRPQNLGGEQQNYAVRLQKSCFLMQLYGQVKASVKTESPN